MTIEDTGRRIWTPGWVYIAGASKWHYVDAGGRSLCGKWLYLGSTRPEQGNDDSKDNCGACRKKLAPISSGERQP